MIRCSDSFKKSIAEPYRDQGFLDFSFITGEAGIDRDAYLYFIDADNQVGIETYRNDEVPLFDGRTLGDCIATLEPGRWLLDGTMHSMCVDNKSSYTEYSTKGMSNLVSKTVSNRTGAFVTDGNKMTLRLDIPGNPVKTDTFCILWDTKQGESPISYTLNVTYRDDRGQESTDVIFWDKRVMQAEHVHKLQAAVVVEQLELRSIIWGVKGSRLRLAEVVFGHQYSQETEGMSLTSAEVSKEVSVLNNAIPQYTATLTFDNTSRFFDPLGLSGIVTELQKGLAIDLRWGLLRKDYEFEQDIDYTESERWYLESWEAPSDSSEFTMTLASEYSFISGNYEPLSFIYDNAIDTRKTLYVWAKDVVQFGTGKAVTRSILRNAQNPLVRKYSVGWPKVDSCVNVLQTMAQAMQCFLSVDSFEGRAQLSCISDALEPVASISENEVVESPTIEWDSRIKEIMYNIYKFSRSTGTIEVKTEVAVGSNMQTLYMDFGTYKPDNASQSTPEANVLQLPGGYFVNGVVLYEDQFWFLGRQAKFIVDYVKDTEEGSAYIGADVQLPYLETKTSYTRVIDTEGETLTIDNNFMFNSASVFGYINSILPIIKNQKLLTIKTIGEVYLEPGDTVMVETEYGLFKVLVTKITISYDGGFTATIEGRSVES